MSEELYNMKLHQVIQIDGIKILRVPGGWWYNYEGSKFFVKFDAEFKYSNVKFDLSVDQIVNTISAYYYNRHGCPRGFHKMNVRKPIQVEGRQMIAKMLTEILELKQLDVCKELNYKERSSITHCIKEMNRKMDENLKTRDRYIFLMQELNEINKK